MNRLLIMAQDASDYADLIKAANLPQLEVVQAADVSAALGVVAGSNIILGEPNMVSEMLDSAGELEWVQSSWAGVDRLCHSTLRRDYVLTGVKDIFGALISEYVVSYVLALERRIFDMRANQHKNLWKPYPYRLLKDIKLGVVGLGSIGTQVAGTIQQLGICVTGLNRSGSACAAVQQVYTADRLAEFLAELDYVVLTLPDTPETHNFVNADVLRMMKSSAVLINVGRGSIVCEEDLIQALQKDEIGAAVLDVFENEPLPAESALWNMPNVYVTPHCAAASFPQDVVDIFADNYHRFLDDRPLLHQIDFDLGY